jgi:RND family efflux transporter MFP subunit
MNKRISRFLALILAFGTIAALLYAPMTRRVQAAAAENKLQKKRTVYVCPMGDDVVSDKPGKCPKCGMALVPKTVTGKLKAVSAQDGPHGAPASGQSMGEMPMPNTTASGERKVLYWYDPMHPAYHSDKPGTAPDCGMELVPKYADEEKAAMNMPPGSVMISPDKQQLIGVRTQRVQRQALVRNLRTTGEVVADESKIAHVHVKVSGFVEDAYVNFVGQLVKKGQPLFTLYSPDLVSAEQEYLIAKRGAQELGASHFSEVSTGAKALLEATRERLRLWDVSDEQIRKLDETGEVSHTLTFYSPITGFVQDRKVYHHTAVTPDTELYMISDLSTIWVNADVYEYEVPFVHIGQRAEVRLSYYPGKTWTGRVSFIYPSVDPATRTVKVRLEFPNPNYQLKPQMFADVQFNVDYGNQIVVPQEAVLDSGNDQVVFVAHDGYFEPRRIRIGAQVDGKVIVLSGLRAGETVVTSGNFLIDSESRLKSAMGAMQH